MIDEALERRLSAAAGTDEEEEIRAVYADWLEARGRADMAKALRAYRSIPFAPVSLRLREPPDDATPTWIVSVVDFPKPFELLVVDDWTGRPGHGPIMDQKERSVSLSDLDRRMAETKIDLPFDLAAAGLGRGRAVVRIRSLADCEPASIAAQLSSGGLAGEAHELGLAHVFRDERFRTVERSWRSLSWLLRRASPPMAISIVQASAEELILDREDAPSLGKSGIWYLPPNRNHLGMAPEAAVLLGPPVPPDERGVELLRAFGEVARLKTTPFVTATDLDVTSAHAFIDALPSLGRHVTVAAPPFVLREAHPFEREPLTGHASYLLAARMAESYRLHAGGGGIRGPLPGVRLAKNGGLAESIYAASRGISAFIQRGPDAELSEAVTASAAAGGETRSLDLHCSRAALACCCRTSNTAADGSRIYRRMSATTRPSTPADWKSGCAGASSTPACASPSWTRRGPPRRRRMASTRRST